MKALPDDETVESRLAALRERIPAWRDAALEFQPLEGGITNKNFRVEAGGASYVLRLFGAGSEMLGINREHEHVCSMIAARLGVGAEVVFYDPAAGLLVTRFIEGAVLSPEAASRPEVIARIAEKLRVVHGGPDFPGRFSPFEMARAYHRQAFERHAAFPERFQPCFAVMERVKHALAGGPPPRPCHNDLLAGNFLDDGRNIWILDWEYAAMGDLFFDLGFFAVNLELDDAACHHLLACYFGEAGEVRLARLRLMCIASHLREGFWGLLQAAISDLDFDFLAYGGGHLERCLALAARPEFEQWLDRTKAGCGVWPLGGKAT